MHRARTNTHKLLHPYVGSPARPDLGRNFDWALFRFFNVSNSIDLILYLIQNHSGCLGYVIPENR